MQLSTRARSRTLPQVLALLLVLGVLPLLVTDARLEELLTLAMIYAIAAVALDLFAGYAGQFSFGQFAFVGLGAYGATVLHGEFGQPFAIAVVGTLLLCAVVAAVIGAAMVRLPHLGSALTTFFFAFVAANLLGGQWLSAWTGGANGLYVPPVEVFGVGLETGPPLYYAALSVLLIVATLASRYANSRAGRALRLIKQSELAAAIVGVGVYRAKLAAFIFAAMAAGAAGVLISLVVGYLSAESFAPAESIILFAMVAVGGFGTLAGPILGALFFTLVPELFLGTGATRAILFSGALLVSLIFLPGGLYSLLDWMGRQLVRHRTRPAIPVAEAVPAAPAVAPAVADRPLLLEATDITVRFGDTLVLDGVSLQVRAGSVHAIIGPNGAGKTTLLNCVSGIQPVTRGGIRVAQADVSRDGPAQRCRLGLARTFQHPALVQDLSVLDNVRLGLYGHERGWLIEDLFWSGRTARREKNSIALAHASLDRLAFPPERRGVLAADLTLAEQKLVDIARALAGQPRVVLLDEPSAGLSEQEIQIIAEAIRQMRRPDLALVVIAHHVHFVSAIADQVTVLHLGHVLAEGPPAEVTRHPAVREVFLGV
jgi:branched-chain amino acid transport system permease protein